MHPNNHPDGCYDAIFRVNSNNTWHFFWPILDPLSPLVSFGDTHGPVPPPPQECHVLFEWPLMPASQRDDCGKWIVLCFSCDNFDIGWDLKYLFILVTDDIMTDNLAGQLWFGAECLAAGSSIMHKETESEQMRPLAKAVTKSLETGLYLFYILPFQSSSVLIWISLDRTACVP
jgi:hypothetical protein